MLDRLLVHCVYAWIDSATMQKGHLHCFSLASRYLGARQEMKLYLTDGHRQQSTTALRSP